MGCFVRATTLDGLPQPCNIFQGDMSFVGPRALMPDEIEVNYNGEASSLDEIPGYSERHQVLPGLTGLAQVCLPRNAPRRDKFRYDLMYVPSQSLWVDLKLSLFRSGSRSEGS